MERFKRTPGEWELYGAIRKEEMWINGSYQNTGGF